MIKHQIAFPVQPLQSTIMTYLSFLHHQEECSKSYFQNMTELVTEYHYLFVLFFHTII